MADNSNNGNDGSSPIDANDIISAVALVISLIALLGTIAQVLQQYYASAAGYSNCGESVMGNWHTTKRRIFRPTELRFEVQFEAPVIFVSLPTNKNGPVPDADIYYINGEAESYRHTRTLPQEREKAWTQLRSNRVHTADNERATWVTLLSELQSMEQQSREWQASQYGKNPPSPGTQSTFDDHTLAVAVQAKKRSWDTMPNSVRKPYATTTICHLLEIAAMMGIYWKEFDRTKDRYRAEGNGYMLTGANVTDLGTMFTFQLCGKRRFEENRVIPVDEVKEMCCGFMPTIFRTNKDLSRLEFPNEDPLDCSVLHLGSMGDIAETLVLLGCNTNTANFFRSDSKKHSHLFPIPFELLGMLGKTLHIPKSCFRMLPNPTPFHWDKKFFSLRKLMKEYLSTMRNDDIMVFTAQTSRLTNMAEKIVLHLPRDSTLDFPIPLLEALRESLVNCDTYLRDNVSRDLTLMVIREHFQRVLGMLNGEDDGYDEERESEDGSRAKHFDDLDSASPEERQEKFIDIYFTAVLPDVRQRAVTAFKRRTSTRYAPSNRDRENSASTAHSGHPAASPSAMTPPVSPQPPGLQAASSSNSIPLVSFSPAGPTGMPRTHSEPTLHPTVGQVIETLDSQASDIWCTLVFRMLAWLLLHDFHKKDVQIPKSELLGSRLPVYIA